MHGVMFKETTATERTLRNCLEDPVKRGQDFLRRNAKYLDCVSRHADGYGSLVVHEKWTQLLILEATNDRTLVDFVEHPGKCNFFKGKPQLTTDHYPDDLDTTSVALTVLKYDQKYVNPILDEMLSYVNSDGIITHQNISSGCGGGVSPARFVEEQRASSATRVFSEFFVSGPVGSHLKSISLGPQFLTLPSPTPSPIYRL